MKPIPDNQRHTYVGPAGWSYEDWKGVVYPLKRARGFSELEYLARYFDTIEINTTFYRPPTPWMVREWVRKVEQNRRFRFTAKLWQGFTHEGIAPGSEEERLFREGIAPLLEADRLGALLVQFPWRFKNEAENRLFLSRLLDAFAEYPLVVEFRHASWLRREIFDFLRERNVGFANIDQPVIGRSIPPTSEVTAPIAYVRFHGRNYADWFREDAGRDARYNYLYSDQELEEWADRVRDVERKAKATFLIYNNHYGGKAVVNALQMKAKLTGAAVPVPEPLLAHFPELRSIAAPEGGRQLELGI
ncbi:MAG: DUF72 domain-containing protein [candidate division KSB1 bacterium]|nr:DUF72 domain-containing protein [candidate division KSB1 bacterium]